MSVNGFTTCRWTLKQELSVILINFICEDPPYLCNPCLTSPLRTALPVRRSDWPDWSASQASSI